MPECGFCPETDHDWETCHWRKAYLDARADPTRAKLEGLLGELTAHSRLAGMQYERGENNDAATAREERAKSAIMALHRAPAPAPSVPPSGATGEPPDTPEEFLAAADILWPDDRLHERPITMTKMLGHAAKYQVRSLLALLAARSAPAGEPDAGRTWDDVAIATAFACGFVAGRNEEEYTEERMRTLASEYVEFAALRAALSSPARTGGSEG